MKKIIATLIVLFTMSVFAFSQENSHIYYVEVYEALGTETVIINYGGDAPSVLAHKLFDENENIEFKNVVAAINFLSAQGWEVVTVSMGDYVLKFDSNKHPKNAIVTSIDEYLQKLQK